MSYNGRAAWSRRVVIFQCPCNHGNCLIEVPYMQVQLGNEQAFIEIHEFWTHDYTGEMDVVTGMLEFS